MDCGSFSVCLIDEHFECEYIYRDFLLQSTEVSSMVRWPSESTRLFSAGRLRVTREDRLEYLLAGCLFAVESLVQSDQHGEKTTPGDQIQWAHRRARPLWWPPRRYV